MHRMYSSVVGLAPALLLLHVSALTRAPDPIRCRRVITESCKLRWSQESLDFSLDPNCQFKSTPYPPETSGSPAWCVSTAKSQSVRIKFEFFANGRLVEMTNCRIDPDRACKSPCVALDIDRQSGVIGNTVADVKNVRVVLPAGVEIQRYTVVNASAGNGHLTRPVKRATRESLASSHFHRTHRYQRRRRRRRKNRRRRMQMKMIASEFISELIDKARRLGATDRSSLTRLLRRNRKLSSQVEKIRSYDSKTPVKSFKNSKLEGVPNISAQYDYTGSDDDKRFKRDPENARAAAENLQFCRLTSQRGITARDESRLSSNEVTASPGRWVTPTLPFTVLADDSLVILNISDLSYLGRALLKHLVISIEYGVFETLKPKTVVSDLISSSTTVVSYSSVLNSSAARPLANNITTAAVAISGGLLFLIVTVAALILLPKSRSGRFPRSKSRRCDCPSVSESENRLYLADSAEEKTTSECCSEGKRHVENSVDEIVSENTLTMLECKRCTRERNKGKSRRSCANFKSSKAASDRSSTCHHAAGIVGSSRHDHCIVCQIAETPHAPIVDAQQYNSQVMPSSDRQTRGAAASVDGDVFDLYRGGIRANTTHDSVSSLPQTVRLPDGEEIRRGEQRRLGGLMSQGSAYRVCVKAPPNRTVYSCDALPFAPFNNNSPRLKVTDYKGQSAGRNKHKNCAGLAAKDNPRTQLGGRAYSCRCLVNHMGDPPPDYSDVVS